MKRKDRIFRLYWSWSAIALLAMPGAFACAREPFVAHDPAETGRPREDGRSGERIAPAPMRVDSDIAAKQRPRDEPTEEIDSSIEPEPNPEPEPQPFEEPVPAFSRKMPASLYANLSPAGCRNELKKRQLPFSRARGPAKGIANPLRFDGPLHGVRFVAPGSRSPFGMLDCRLALTLDEMARVLHEYGVSEVRADNMYRPHARLPGKRKPSQHSYGLAIDILAFKLGDEVELSIQEDWHSELGSIPCGPESSVDNADERSIILRNLVCEVARQGLFHHMLTPSYNEAHKDHLHFDIKRDAKSRSVE